MKIAVIADTHDKIAPGLLETIAAADEIWHLGDVTTTGTLAAFQKLGPPLHLVRGNCDSETSWPMTLTREIGGLRFMLIHIPPVRPPTGAEILLHGHTHVPRNEMVGPTRYLNPGCITRPNRGAAASFAWLEILGEKTFRWTPVLLAGLGK